MIDYEPHHWLSHLLDIRGSMIREMFGRVGICVAWAALVVAVHKYVHPVGLPATVHTLTGLALGLLLVFRTNASYDRYWEGRRQWGSIVNASRALGHGALTYLERAPAVAESAILWTVAFAYASMSRLRGQVDLGPVADRLPGADVAFVRESSNPPLAITLRISDRFNEARAAGLLTDYEQVELDRIVRGFLDYLGACERIRNTPLPFVYVVHLRRALILYCLTLPFALVKEFGWACVLDMFMVAYLFFGIEEIGVEIEDPFGLDPNDLPLERICGVIEKDLTSLIDEERSRSGSSASSIPTTDCAG